LSLKISHISDSSTSSEDQKTPLGIALRKLHTRLDYQLRPFAVFGFVARADDFDTETSDADFLIEFKADSATPSLRTFFGLRDALATILNRSVDLVDPSNIENPYLLKKINQDRESIYEKR